MKRGPNGTLAAYVIQTPNLPRAACVGTDPALWDADRRDRRDEALAICGRCKELAPCRAWADSVRLYELNSVVVGGMVRRSITAKKESNND